MALYSFRTEKQFKMIFFTDNDEEAFNLVFLKVYLELVTLGLRITYMYTLFLDLKAK